MSVTRFKYLEALSAITPVHNALLTAGDLITDVFAKLQGLLQRSSKKVILTSNLSGGASTTADVAIQTLTIVGNDSQLQDLFEVEIHGVWTKPSVGGSSTNFWVKINGTKEALVTLPNTASVTNRGFHYKGLVIVRQIGVNGSVMVTGNAVFNTTATAATALHSTDTAPVTVNVTNNWTIQTGFNFSNSNASNNITIVNAKIHQKM